MTNLAGEIDKAAAHTTTGEIRKYNIDAVCSPVLDAVIFDLTDAITAGKFDRAVSLVGELCDEYDIEIGADEIVPENFNSVEAIWALVQRLQED